MKKIRCRLGRKAEFWSLTICEIVILIAICWDILNDSATKMEVIIGTGYLFTTLIIMVFDQTYSWYIQLQDDKLYLKRPFRTLRVYNVESIIMKYGIRRDIGARGREGIYPCLIVGTSIPQKNIFIRGYFGGRIVFENYFLIVLTAQKLNYITAWYNQKIELPKKEEFIEINTEGAKRVRQFYDLIEKYNNTLMLNEGAKDENSGQSDAL